MKESYLSFLFSSDNYVLEIIELQFLGSYLVEKTASKHPARLISVFF